MAIGRSEIGSEEIGGADIGGAELEETPEDLLPETEALIAAMPTPPTGGRQLLLNQVIGQLIASGVWAKLDALYLFAAADAAAAVINWKDPGTFDATLVNSPAFAADRGFTPNGSNGYIDLNFNPTTAGGNYTQNSASFGFWSRTAAASSGSDAGWFNGTQGVSLAAHLES